MARGVFWGTVAILLVGGLYFGFWRERPYMLIRFTAARAIEATAEFQHKTKLFFEIGQAEAVIPGACHNFDFAPTSVEIFQHYTKAGVLQFSPYRNQGPPYGVASPGSLDFSLGDGNFLVDTIDACTVRDVTKSTGAYELKLGKAIVEVSGIRVQDNRATVDFEWHFESLNRIGQASASIQNTKELQIADSRTTQHEKSIAPFWLGTAEFAKYDDGWRALGIKLSSSQYPWGSWDYGPQWPDERFDWGAFDEHENRWRADGTKAE